MGHRLLVALEVENQGHRGFGPLALDRDAWLTRSEVRRGRITIVPADFGGNFKRDFVMVGDHGLNSPFDDSIFQICTQ